ncbi:MAG: GntR family transcriptional regulator [Hydrogenophaga sp.]|uniref:GntR family transcriptional regulator n=1 Tax=Hydrogenophaga sp. TaxID=1904254 RepID=UPI002756B538|nr:GntR family transcriptional regulator [Hydrogenophaga sp.]MDP2416869.1 GntR family transcriptional regulator [Hydrogenophaga sp.]MDZ4189442.1 GntR family transcriptional regulator [Hydrogenophaga sp.]
MNTPDADLTETIEQALAASGESVQVRALLQLRQLILSGELAGGTRIAELSIVERLGVSRTPVRAALLRLEQEGLLQSLPSGGYRVQSFTERDIADGIELRGTLEGLLARLAAERVKAPELVANARECLAQIDLALATPTLDDERFSAYAALNSRFHSLLCEMAASPTIARQLERAAGLPFASPSGFVLLQTRSARARDMLVVAQDQHRQVLDAIEQCEGARAEAIMREHSRLARRNLVEVLAGQPPAHTPASMPSFKLIRRCA